MNSVMPLDNPYALAEMLNESSIDAIIAIDPDRKIIAWNTAAAQISGLTKEQVLGHPLLEVWPALKNDRVVLEAFTQAFKGEKGFIPASAEFAHRRHMENHYIPLRDAADTVVGVMNIMHDATHYNKAETQLKRLNRQLEKRYRELQKTADELASFTYLSSKNIKEPIKNIYTTVEQLIRNEARKLSDSGKASFRRIQSSLTKMNLLLDDLLSLSHINILQKPNQKVNLQETVQKVMTALSHKIQEGQVQIEVKDLCTVTGHPEQLHLLFYHLFDNAIKFNKKEQPSIRVDCRKVWIEEVHEGVMEEKEYWHISVEDNGIGFEMEHSEKIFNMFEKLHSKNAFKGSGIGLAIARKIMDSHDGFITVESIPGDGTVFHCYFPTE